MSEPATICHEVIHYPSEDYPCLCERLVLDEAGNCLECGHTAEKHSTSNSVPRERPD